MAISTVLVVLLVAQCAFAVPRFFGDDAARIVGGQTAEPGQFPYQVSLRNTTTNRHFCGGSIIRSDWVLSAAHCFYRSIGPGFTHIVLNGHVLNEDGVIYETAEVVIHEDYDPETINNDVAVIRSETPFEFSLTAHPISLGDGSDAEIGAIARASGWGRLWYQGPLPEELQFIDLTLLSNSDCRSRHTDIYQPLIYDGLLCAYSNYREQGMCHGDSGGPLVHNGVQVGLVSWGVPCAAGRPDGFTRVSYFLPWINLHAGEDED